MERFFIGINQMCTQTLTQHPDIMFKYWLLYKIKTLLSPLLWKNICVWVLVFYLNLIILHCDKIILKGSAPNIKLAQNEKIVLHRFTLTQNRNPVGIFLKITHRQKSVNV